MNIRDSFDGWEEADVRAFMEENYYLFPRQLEGGEWVGLVRLAYTWSVCCDIRPATPFIYRWCFEDRDEAIYFLESMVDFDEVPEHKTSLRGHRYRTEPLYREKDEMGFEKW